MQASGARRPTAYQQADGAWLNLHGSAPHCEIGTIADFERRRGKQYLSCCNSPRIEIASITCRSLMTASSALCAIWVPKSEMQEQQHHHEGDDLAARLGRSGQRAPRPAFRSNDDRRSDDGADQVSDADDDRHEQIVDAGIEAERIWVDEAQEIREQPAIRRRRRRARTQPVAGGIDAEGFRQSSRKARCRPARRCRCGASRATGERPSAPHFTFNFRYLWREWWSRGGSNP